MSKELNNATDTERTIKGVKYVGKKRIDGCNGCAGNGHTILCLNLPNCGQHRTDGRDLIFVAETKDKSND